MTNYKHNKQPNAVAKVNNSFIMPMDPVGWEFGHSRGGMYCLYSTIFGDPSGENGMTWSDLNNWGWNHLAPWQ